MAVSERWSKPTLVGEKVTLVPFEPAHVAALWEMVNDPEGNDLTATVETFDFEQIDAWYRGRNDQDGRLDLAVIENATGELAGEVVLNEFDSDGDQASFRISLRGPVWFGRGLGGEATALIIAHGFADVGLKRITLEVLARNPRAIRAYEKNGFTETRRYAEDGEEWIAMAVEAG